MKTTKLFLAMLIAAILGGLVSAGAFFYFSPEQMPSASYGSKPRYAYQISNVTVPTFDFTEVADAVTPTVVHITTMYEQATQRGDNPFEGTPFEDFGFGVPRGPSQASGSGVILSADGYIVTNNHVVADAKEVTVVLYDKRAYKATVIGTDPSTDLAVIKINADELSPVQLGNSDAVRVGEWTLAVGNPFNLTSTVTAGIVSAKARSINLLGGGTSIESFIQTDAAVNPGNSGGALVNVRGELIGINTAIASQTGSYAGYSFAVPVNIVKKVVQDLKEFGEVQRGFIGVNIRDVDAAMAKEAGLKGVYGVYVEAISDNGAAEDAGLKKGDIIVAVEGQRVRSVPELQETIGLHRPGDEVGVTVFRDGDTKDYTLQLRDREGRTKTTPSMTQQMKTRLGAELTGITDVEKKDFEITNGVKVENVTRGLFQSTGIPQGYIITRLDKQPMYTAYDVYRLLNEKEGPVLVEGFMPNGEKKYFVLEMGS